MACVGEAVWAAHPTGWGFADDTNFFLLTPHGVGFDMTFRALDQPLVPHEGQAFPSHVVQESAIHYLRASGAKWITHDDVMVGQVLLTNTSAYPVYVDAQVILPARDLSAQDGRLCWTAEAGGFTVHLAADAPGFAEADISVEPQPQFSAEAESPSVQQGSDGPDTKMGASAGAVLGSGFGGHAGDFAEWTIDVPSALPDAVLSVRYARASQAPASFRLMAGAREIPLILTSTGGWGELVDEFAIERVDLGAVGAGPLSVRLEATEDGVNTNFDFVAVHPARHTAELPSPGAQVRVQHFEVPANQSKLVRVCVAASVDPAKALAALDRVASLPDALASQQEEYTGWLTEQVPAFTSENAALEKVYWHRATSVLRKNLTRPGAGRLTRWAMSEGRWRSAWYPNVISYGAGHQIRELRWLRDGVYVHDFIQTWCENQREDGLFPSHIPPTGDLPNRQYTDWIASSVWDALAVHPDPEKRAAWLPALQRNVDGWLAKYDTGNDGLLTVDSHWWTGMEWQPSFFYFNGFDAEQQGQALERVDLTSYVFGGAMAVSRLLTAEGDAEGAKKYADLGVKIRRALRDRCWDTESNYFYSIDPDTHEKAMVKEVAGVYPFYFSMFDAERMPAYREAFSSVVDPDQLWTRWPVASASKQCPAYSQDGAFHGKPGSACMWNGPTWPHANSLVLPAMGRVLRDYAECALRLEHFQRLLMSYTMAQFRHQDMTYPWTGEYYNGDTGEWRTEERDYNHSTYLDILITELAGLRVRDDDILEIRPLIDEHTPGFILDGLRYRGHDLTIAWTRWRSAKPGLDGRRGLRIYADGNLLYAPRQDVMVKSIYRDMTKGFKPITPDVE